MGLDICKQDHHVFNMTGIKAYFFSLFVCVCVFSCFLLPYNLWLLPEVLSRLLHLPTARSCAEEMGGILQRTVVAHTVHGSTELAL